MLTNNVPFDVQTELQAIATGLSRKTPHYRLRRKGLNLSITAAVICEAIGYQFETAEPLSVETTFYVCEYSVCFKRGYIFYVTPIKHFRFNSRSASDLGAYATSAGA